MEPILGDKLQKLFNISEVNVDTFQNLIVIHDFKKGQIFAKPNQIDTVLRFIVNGIVKCYSIDAFGTDKEKQLIKWINTDKQLATNIDRFLKQEIINDYIEAVTDCQIVSFNMLDISKMAHTEQGLYAINTSLLQIELAQKELRIELLAIADANRRYQFYKEKYSSIIGKINSIDEASFLRISKDTLNEIKKKNKHL